MQNLEKFWRDAHAATPVCTATSATKNMVLNAIMEGAGDLESLKKKVPLCNESNCAKTNPSGHDCTENAAMLLSIYVPVYGIMTQGGGCNHKKRLSRPDDTPGCQKNETGDCGGCSLCDPGK